MVLLGRSLGPLGRSWAPLGRSFGPLGPHLGLLALNFTIFIDFLSSRDRFFMSFLDFWCPPVTSTPWGIAEKTEVFSISRLNAS